MTVVKLSQSGPAASADTGTEVKPSPSTSAPPAVAIGTRPISRRPVAMRRAGEETATGSTEASAPAGKWPTVRITDPTKAGYLERRNTARILKRLHESPPTTEKLTKEVRESIEWAKKVLPNFTLERPTTSSAATKRQRSTEEVKPSAKRPKNRGIAPNKTFAEVARNRIIVGVLDEGDPEGRIPRAQWKWVQAALTNVTLEVLLSNPGSPPSCTDAGWYQGQIKIIAYDDERSVELYKTAIAKIGEVYPGAKLVVVDKKDIPSRPRARVWVPTPSDPQQVMQIISACNPGLPTGSWKFVKVFDNTVTVDGVVTKRATTQVMLLLTNDSLEPLAKSEGMINYGFGKVKVRTYKTDADAIDQLASEIEANDAEEDPMESSSDVESIDIEGYCSSGSELTARLKKMSTSTTTELTAGLSTTYSEKELLSDSQEDSESVNHASSTNKFTSQ
ncbi:uncharacterized protein LOC129250314 [Anastrepha obliqua]|uniref:uncharacterized protein LOC129250314 n=1 Tax=Anastrepha obliqua TaxID=95512 RepID=UPI0024095E14|nr:uncharacterized protein LOC129250314 [Anastrepha obliqua]